ncbi:MAG: MFS transporter [Thermoleophilia bacterium]|nr:MFS transporter [Thermoleophilia bacterium]
MRGARILRPFGIRDFALLWTAMSVSLLGDGIYFVAIAWQVYEISNAPTALSVVGVAWTLPNVLLLLVGGVLSDRFDRRRLMIVSDVVRGLAIAAIGVLSVSGSLELWHLLGLVALYGAGEALFAPAFQAIVPDIVPPEHLVQANSLDMLMRPLAAQLTGPALGGLLIAWIGAGPAFLADAASFWLSAACLAAMSSRPLPLRAAAGARSALADVAEGFRFVRSHTWLWGTLTAAAASLLCFYGPVEVLLPYVVKNDLGGSSRDYGLALAAMGAGSVGAALVIGRRTLPGRHIAFMYVNWTVAVAMVSVFGVAGELWQVMLAGVVRGVGITLGLVVWMTLVQTLVPRELLGRVSSFDWLVSISLIPVSFALTGPVAHALGARETLVGAGVLGAAITLAFLFLPGMRESERAGLLAATPGAMHGRGRSSSLQRGVE